MKKKKESTMKKGQGLLHPHGTEPLYRFQAKSRVKIEIHTMALDPLYVNRKCVLVYGLMGFDTGGLSRLVRSNLVLCGSFSQKGTQKKEK